MAVDPVGLAKSLLDLVTSVYNAYASVGDQIDTWTASQKRLNALRQLVAALQNPGVAAAWTDLQEETSDLKKTLEKALDLVRQLQDERRDSDVLARLRNWRCNKKAVEQLKLELDDVREAADTYTSVVTVKLGTAQLAELIKASDQQREAKRDAVVKEVNNIMATQFAPGGFMRFLEQQQEAMKPDYPLRAFTDTTQATVRSRMLEGMKALTPAWKDLGSCIKDGTLDVDYFKDHLNLLHQGRTYRTLVEPLDICNWYWRRKHVKGSGHYVDGIGSQPIEECTQDNRKRPGRYMHLQDMELKVLREAESSLGIARKLQQDAQLAAKVEAVAAWDNQPQTVLTLCWAQVLRIWLSVWRFILALWEGK